MDFIRSLFRKKTLEDIIGQLEVIEGELGDYVYNGSVYIEALAEELGQVEVDTNKAKEIDKKLNDLLGQGN
jgi:hypothetical protein